MTQGTLEDYRRVYDMLEDAESRDIYLKRLNWLVSRQKRYIDSIVTTCLPGIPVFPAGQKRNRKTATAAGRS